MCRGRPEVAGRRSLGSVDERPETSLVGDGQPVPATATGTAWWSPRAIGLHVTLVVVLPAFAGLFWWQIQRVREGNTLSWAYVFEWPFFAGYAVYLWWHLVHEQPARVGSAVAAAPPTEATTEVEAAGRPGEEAAATGADQDQDRDQEDGEDEELAAYNRYLAELDASGRQKRW